MRALVLDSYEEGTVFRDALINLPSPSAGQVQVKIFASGVNPIDLHILSSFDHPIALTLIAYSH